jgi:hypothetical protein
MRIELHCNLTPKLSRGRLQQGRGAQPEELGRSPVSCNARQPGAFAR